MTDSASAYVHFFSDCCNKVLVTLQNEAKSTYGPREGIYTMKTDLHNGKIQYVSSKNKYTLWYNIEELGWGIGNSGYIGVKQYLITEEDPSAIYKCPNDTTLKWMYAKDENYKNYIGSDVNVECYQEPGTNCRISNDSEMYDKYMIYFFLLT